MPYYYGPDWYLAEAPVEGGGSTDIEPPTPREGWYAVFLPPKGKWTTTPNNPNPPAPSPVPQALARGDVISLAVGIIGEQNWATAWNDNEHADVVTMRSMLMAFDRFNRDDPRLQAGLDALVINGYMTQQQKVAFNTAWLRYGV
jgi:hypothetical protein